MTRYQPLLLAVVLCCCRSGHSFEYFSSIRNISYSVTVRTYVSDSNSDHRLAETEEISAVIDFDHGRVRILRSTAWPNQFDESSPATDFGEHIRTPNMYFDISASTSDRVATRMRTKNEVTRADFDSMLSELDSAFVNGFIPSRILNSPASMRVTELKSSRRTSLAGRGVIVEKCELLSSGIPHTFVSESSTEDSTIRLQYHTQSLMEASDLEFPQSSVAEFTIVPPASDDGQENLEGNLPSGATLFGLAPVKRELKVLRKELTFNEVKLNRDITEAEFEPVSEISNGVPVHLVDAPHLPHRWENGEAIPWVDPDIIAAANGSEFIAPDRGRTRGLWWTLALNLAFAGILLVVWWRKRM